MRFAAVKLVGRPKKARKQEKHIGYAVTMAQYFIIQGVKRNFIKIGFKQSSIWRIQYSWQYCQTEIPGIGLAQRTNISSRRLSFVQKLP